MDIFQIGNIWFIGEILLSENAILWSMPKRKYFAIRIICSSIIAVALAYFFPMPKTLITNQLYQLLRFIVLLGYTIGVIFFSYKRDIVSVITNCTAGYAVQHLIYSIANLITFTGLFEGFSRPYMSKIDLISLIVYPVMLPLVVLLLGFYIKKYKLYRIKHWALVITSIVTVFICVGLTRFSRHFNEYGLISTNLYAIVCCSLALFIQYAGCRTVEIAKENKAIKLVIEKKREQYEISKESMDLINIKYHDLKHRLSDLGNKLSNEEIKSIRDAASVYDCYYKTGNDALDTVLNEHSLRCSRNNIQMTFSGNGKALDFVSIEDIYSLFGNAIENAMEASLKIGEQNKRVISINVEQKGQFISLNISNYFVGEIVYSDGLPKTTKTTEKGFHGYGMKSMKIIAEKYDGGLKVSTNSDVFELNIYLIKQ